MSKKTAPRRLRPWEKPAPDVRRRAFRDGERAFTAIASDEQVWAWVQGLRDMLPGVGRPAFGAEVVR